MLGVIILIITEDILPMAKRKSSTFLQFYLLIYVYVICAVSDNI